MLWIVCRPHFLLLQFRTDLLTTARQVALAVISCTPPHCCCIYICQRLVCGGDSLTDVNETISHSTLWWLAFDPFPKKSSEAGEGLAPLGWLYLKFFKRVQLEMIKWDLKRERTCFYAGSNDVMISRRWTSESHICYANELLWQIQNLHGLIWLSWRSLEPHETDVMRWYLPKTYGD